jgi:beta-galactosidase
VAALVAAADAGGRLAGLLAAAHAALQAAPNPHALGSFERRMGRFLHQDQRQLDAAFALDYAGGFHCTTLHRLEPAGAVELAVSVQPFGPLPPLPRLGIRLALAGACNQVTWFGRGPHENYPDRKTGAALGRYTATAAEQFVSYGRPQENGGKGDVRWVALTDAGGRGLHVAGDGLLHFSAGHYTAADLAGADHLHLLAPRPHVYCNFDCAMSGLGNESCGPGVLPAYQIEPAPRRFTLRLHPAQEYES